MGVVAGFQPAGSAVQVFKHADDEVLPQVVQHLIGVQAAGADAMEKSWRQKRVILADSVNTIADGIGVRAAVVWVGPTLDAVPDVGKGYRLHVYRNFY